jgi:hypothetical protein
MAAARGPCQRLCQRTRLGTGAPDDADKPPVLVVEDLPGSATSDAA